MGGYTTLEFETRDSQHILDITSDVRKVVRDSGVSDGLCLIFSMHTTAGITINENADPDVKTDIISGLSRAFPERSDYRHMEGNSHSHLRTSCIGPSQTVIVSDGDLVLGTWQGVFLCEFDGPRRRRVAVKVCEM